jgi:low temperature requirement protein LtrA
LTSADDAGRRVSTLELFFDLVFVFTLTQLTGLLEHDPTWETFGRVVLLFVTLFWMYGGYAWLLNQVPPNRTHRQLLVIASMAAFMVSALAVPSAFGDSGIAFGFGYLLVVIVHAGLYVQTAGVGVLRFFPLNLLGAVALIGASFLEGASRYALWLVPVVLQFLSAALTRRVDESTEQGFRLHPDHFVERHGLLLIVALGESVVAVGIGLAGVTLDAGTFVAVVLGVALAGSLWWLYFVDDDRLAEQALSRAVISDRLRMALNGFFYSYIPMLLGVVVLAAGASHALGNASDPLDSGNALLLGGGVALYLAGNIGFRATMAIMPVAYRAVAAVLAVATIPLGVSISAMSQLVGLGVILVAMLAIEPAAREIQSLSEGQSGPAD